MKSRKPRHRTLQAWFDATLGDRARDIANWGADGGYPGITYNSDAAKVFDKFEDEIWELAVTEAESMGAKNVMDFIAGFRRIDMADDFTTFKTLMVWFAVEDMARRKADAEESED